MLFLGFFKKNYFPHPPPPSVILPLPISGSLKEKEKKVVSKMFSPAAVNTLHDEFQGHTFKVYQ